MSSFIKPTQPFLQRVFILTVFAALFALLSACSSDDVKEDPYLNWSAKDFYLAAKSDLKLAEFEAAIKKLETLEARYPFSKFAKQAQLDVAYAYYKYDEPDSTISAVKRFIRLHPRSAHIDYAIYLKGLANFYRGSSFLDGMFPRNLAEHDQQNLKQAIKDFTSLISNYPQSIYAPDAYLRSIFLRNELAEAAIISAEYYMLREAWIAAINRAQTVIMYYQTAPARDRALDIMINAYKKLGMDQLAKDTQAIKDMNPAASKATLPADSVIELTQRKDPLTPQIN
ncbi:MAG: outer membrane protein assembly factor BamD [Gammaproteobacteria bacterium]|nr:outer membrane protein assembly factor BamD [Gammaproteobacteria bacterium]